MGKQWLVAVVRSSEPYQDVSVFNDEELAKQTFWFFAESLTPEIDRGQTKVYLSEVMISGHLSDEPDVE